MCAHQCGLGQPRRVRHLEANGQPVGTYRQLDVLEQARIDHVLEKLPRRLGSLHGKGAWLPQQA
jgi:hypothetical protein